MASRVLIAQFMHETNTFSKLPTTLDDYRRQRLVEGEAIVPNFTGTRNELGGFIDAALLWLQRRHRAVGAVGAMRAVGTDGTIGPVGPVGTMGTVGAASLPLGAGRANGVPMSAAPVAPASASASAA